MEIINTIGIVLVGVLLITMGWVMNILYDDYTNQRFLNGLQIKDTNWKGAMEIADDLDEGDWVCINVKGMEYKTMVDTCVHESAHEIFAEIIENEPEKIEEVMEVTGK